MIDSTNPISIYDQTSKNKNIVLTIKSYRNENF